VGAQGVGQQQPVIGAGVGGDGCAGVEAAVGDVALMRPELVAMCDI
jgi:hypothetical protein